MEHFEEWKGAVSALGLGGLFLWIFLRRILVSEKVGADAIQKQKAIAEQYEKKMIELYGKLEEKDLTVEIIRSQLFEAEKFRARAEGKLLALGVNPDEVTNDQSTHD